MTISGSIAEAEDASGHHRSLLEDKSIMKRFLVGCATALLLGFAVSSPALAAPAPSTPSPAATAVHSISGTLPAMSTGGTFTEQSGGATITFKLGAASLVSAGPTVAAAMTANAYVEQYASVIFSEANFATSLSGYWQYNGTYAYNWGSEPNCHEYSVNNVVISCFTAQNGPNTVVWESAGWDEATLIIGYTFWLYLYGNGNHQWQLNWMGLVG